MRLAELSELTHVPVPTIKFYLREGLLRPGTPITARQSDYDDTHVHRLRLIRGLSKVHGSTLEEIRRVLDIVETNETPLDATGQAEHARLAENVEESPEIIERRQRTREYVAALGFSPRTPDAFVDQLGEVLHIATLAGFPPVDSGMQVYARAAMLVAESEMAAIPWDDAPNAASQALLGTMLYEPVFGLMRKMGHYRLGELSFFASQGITNPDEPPADLAQGPEWARRDNQPVPAPAPGWSEPVEDEDPGADTDSGDDTAPGDDAAGLRPEGPA